MEKPVESSAQERNLRMGGFAILEHAVVVVIGILLTIAMNTMLLRTRQGQAEGK